jgi:hypothetical protein
MPTKLWGRMPPLYRGRLIEISIVPSDPSYWDAELGQRLEVEPRWANGGGAEQRVGRLQWLLFACGSQGTAGHLSTLQSD